MNIIIDEARLAQVMAKPLLKGAHTPDGEMCVMEAAAFIINRPWTDHDENICPVIGAFMRSWNDGLPTDEDRNRLLKPLLTKIIGTKNQKLEERRSLMAADWLVRVHTPAWLRLAGLVTQAEKSGIIA